MERLSFATLVSPGRAAAQARLLGSSIRRFGARLASSPIRVMVVGEPADESGWSEVSRGLVSLGATITPLAPVEGEAGFSLLSRVAAAAEAERCAGGEDDLLVWLDADTIVLQEPSAFLLPSTVSLGCRAVHHRLIGPAWEEPLDRFWELIYSAFGVSEDRPFPMITHVGERIRAYLSAGVLAVRLGRGLLARWWSNCRTALDHPGLLGCCQESAVHALFLHQAALTATVLAALPAGEMRHFGPEINYPLHLHCEVPPDRRPSLVDDLTTIRYEDVFDRPDWPERFPMSGSLRVWLESRLAGARQTAVRLTGSGGPLGRHGFTEGVSIPWPRPTLRLGDVRRSPILSSRAKRELVAASSASDAEAVENAKRQARLQQVAGAPAGLMYLGSDDDKEARHLRDALTVGWGRRGARDQGFLAAHFGSAEYQLSLTYGRLGLDVVLKENLDLTPHTLRLAPSLALEGIDELPRAVEAAREAESEVLNRDIVHVVLAAYLGGLGSSASTDPGCASSP